MDGKRLLSMTVRSVQEMRMKIGDSAGSVSLYYPNEGDFEILEKEFKEESAESLPGIVLERLPGRVRVTVPEKECESISRMPVNESMEFVVSLAKEAVPLTEFLRRVKERYPDVRSGESGVIDFDWILSFPGDDDVYCLSEELGRTTCHRFSEEDYLSMGFRLPVRGSFQAQIPSGAGIDADDRNYLDAGADVPTCAAGLESSAHGASADLAQGFAVRRLGSVRTASVAVDHVRGNIHAVQLAPQAGHLPPEPVIVVLSRKVRLACLAVQSAIRYVPSHVVPPRPSGTRIRKECVDINRDGHPDGMRNVLSAVVMFAVLLVFVVFWFYTAIGTDAPPAMSAAGIVISTLIVIAGLKRFLRRAS
jgi:hypothetical protein